MRRRHFLGLLAGVVASCRATYAQSNANPRRIGILIPYRQDDDEFSGRVLAFKQELTRRGWTEGTTVRFDERWTADDMDQVRAAAQSIMGANPDAVVAIGGRVIPLLLQFSRSVPIVVPGAVDPVGVGWVESLARPGGNITGFTFLELSIFGKMLETLKQIAPSTTRVANVHNPDNRSTAAFKKEFERAASALALEAISIPVHDMAAIERAATELVARPHSAVFFPPDVTIQAFREQIVPLLGRTRIPAIYTDDVFVRIGGLASYAADRKEIYRQAASYVDRILRGEKSAELPFQQPTKYQLKINLKTAKNLGLELSPTLLATADEVIE
jgi:putative ABC transport system substrate-binding protein